MIRLLICLCLVTCGTGAFAQSPKTEQKPDSISVFITGNELGALQPCGCAGGQLGGLDRRAAIFNSAAPEKRLIFDTGNIVEDTTPQNLIKFSIVLQAFDLLDYDLLNLTEPDLESAKNLALLSDLGSFLNVITAHTPQGSTLPAAFTKNFLLNGKALAVTIAAFDGDQNPKENIRNLFPSEPCSEAVNILVLSNCDPNIINSIGKMGIADCLICPSQSDEPAIIQPYNQCSASPLVVSTGRVGRYVIKLQITEDPTRKKLQLCYTSVAVKENLPLDDSLVQLYKDYQQLVIEANLLEKYPRYPLSNELEYTGSKACERCHESEYKKWKTQPHAHAYKTLEKVGSQYDPECIICHVVGMEYESGFGSKKNRRDLENVGCENCHGPGSKHIKADGKTPTSIPKSNCIDCHTSQRSDYLGNEEEYFKKIVHWREQNSSSDVKSKGK